VVEPVGPDWKLDRKKVKLLRVSSNFEDDGQLCQLVACVPVENNGE
jgi:hypothetical protein